MPSNYFSVHLLPYVLHFGMNVTQNIHQGAAQSPRLDDDDNNKHGDPGRDSYNVTAQNETRTEAEVLIGAGWQGHYQHA